MGRSKAELPFGSQTMLERVVERVGQAAAETLVVAAVGQPLGKLPASVQIVRDETPGAGPLAGLAAGLKRLSPQMDAVFVTGCDVPLVQPGFIERLHALLDKHDCVTPLWHGIEQPLASVYHPRIAPVVATHLAEERLSLRGLLEQIDTLRIDAEELRDVDPRLDSLSNCNTPEQYRAAMERAGIVKLGE
jgi:molybdopterin-guanine dinucleotide biosynthesis protein A